MYTHQHWYEITVLLRYGCFKMQLYHFKIKCNHVTSDIVLFVCYCRIYPNSCVHGMRICDWCVESVTIGKSNIKDYWTPSPSFSLSRALGTKRQMLDFGNLGKMCSLGVTLVYLGMNVTLIRVIAFITYAFKCFKIIYMYLLFLLLCFFVVFCLLYPDLWPLVSTYQQLVG